MSELIQADLLKWLRDNQWLVQNGYIPKAHAVIGDPPYGLEFMGKEWDKHATPQDYQAWVTEWATLLLDFVYPGAVLALFGGTRTYHRLAAGLEDAGWEVFDCMMYLYGSGFPKAADIGKAIDRKAGAEREVVGQSNRGAGASPQKLDNHGHGDTGIGYLDGNGKVFNLTAPATPAAQRWDGYKTALKPAYEPIVLARAPRGSTTYADLAQQYGTGAINIDGGRIKANGDVIRSSHNVTIGGNGIYQGGRAYETGSVDGRRYPANLALDEHAAKLLDAQSGESVSKRTDRGRGFSSNGSNEGWKRKSHDNPDYQHIIGGFDDSGGASRFFYTAKAPSWEREAGLSDFDPTIVNDGRNTPIDNAYQRGDTRRRNTHPTLKPIQLCQWLATLLLPPPLDTPRRLLVPFAGSGSEMIGAQLAGWDEIVGVEREAEYCAINEARRRWWAKFKTYEQAELAYRPPVQTTDDLSDLPLFASAE